MAKYKKPCLFFLTMVICLFSLSGCVTEKDLKEPVQRYLDEKYGFKERFEFLTWDNNWFEGIAHQTAIEISEPYHATAYIKIERDTYKVDEEDSDNVFFELYKGAYIEQHPDVIKAVEELMEKYNLMKKSASEYDTMKGNYYYYLNVRMNEQQEQALTDVFKQTQTIDTIHSLRDMTDPLTEESYTYRGVINFNFAFNTYKQNKDVPQAEEILQDLDNSHVLTEGLYCISVHTIEASKEGTSQGIDPRNSNIRFRVDTQGVVQDIDVSKG